MALAPVALNPQPKAMASTKQRTLVVDDSPTILHAICSLLEHYELVDVVGRAESGPEAVDAVASLQPEMVLIDADMPGMSGLRTALLLSQSAPATRVVLMSMDTSREFRRACAGCGAQAVIYKPRFLSELGRLLAQEMPRERQKSFPRPRRKAARAISIMR